MGRLPRAPPKIGGVPITPKTLKDLSVAAVDVAFGRTVPVEDAQKRWDICQTCEMFDGKRCALCGCFMRKKVALPSSTCPMNKWPR